jgi:hypothetical protein
MFPIPEAAMPAVIANVTFTALALIVVLMRLGTRIFVLKNVGVDDGLIVLSMVRLLSFFFVPLGGLWFALFVLFRRPFFVVSPP